MRGSRLAIARHPAYSHDRRCLRVSVGERRRREMSDEQGDSTRTAEDEDRPQGAEQGGDSHEEGEEKSDFEKETEEAKEEVKQLEDDPPGKLEDWPTGK